MRFLILLTLISLSAVAHAQTGQAADMVQGWKVRLNLTEDQTAKVKALVEQQVASLKTVAEQKKSGEADRQASMQALKQSRANLESGLDQILTPEQKQQLPAIKAQFQQHAQHRMAEQRVDKLGETLGLNDGQKQKMIPIFARQIAEMSKEMEAVQSASGRRAKMQAARQLKDTQEETNKELSQILSPDQMSKYEAMQEEQREQTRQRFRQRRQ